MQTIKGAIITVGTAGEALLLHSCFMGSSTNWLNADSNYASQALTRQKGPFGSAGASARLLACQVANSSAGQNDITELLGLHSNPVAFTLTGTVACMAIRPPLLSQGLWLA